MTKIVDNSKEKLSTTLNNVLEDAGEIAIASAYFNVNGYGALRSALKNKTLKFLLGREPTESIKWEDEIIRELEENEDEKRYFELLQEAIGYFESEKVGIRSLAGPFFHGKAYIGAHPALDEVKRGVGVVGSSNFTRGGLVTNRELNMLNTDREVVQELVNWFQDAWSHSVDYKEQFLSSLNNYVTTRSPYEVVAKALYETYKHVLDASVESQKVLQTLMPHQKLSFRDALFILDRYKGVLIADATGLGKSRIMLNLALNATREGRKCLLIAPKSVLDTTWKQEFAATHYSLDQTVSTEMLSRNPDLLNEDRYSDAGFVMVDEAHDFKRPSTNRYVALRDLLLKTNAQIALATATPVNNSLMDLYSLLSLYLPEDSITDLYQQTLKGFFTASQKRWLSRESIDMEKVLERFIVRHSRRLAVALGEGKLSFPERVLDTDPRTKYDAEVDYELIDKKLEALNFAFYDMAIDRLGKELRMPDGTSLPPSLAGEKKANLKKLVKTIVVIGIFKRLESSLQAFRSTMQSLSDYMENAIRYAEDKGYFVPRSMRDEPIFDFDEELPSPEELFSNPKYAAMKEKCELAPVEAHEFTEKCKEDMRAIREMLAAIPGKDEKFTSFQSRLKDIIAQISRSGSNGVIIFTQFETTADYLYERLLSMKTGVPVLLVTGSRCVGSSPHREKWEVIEEFQKSGGLLVSTDVLSEGQNLQNAQFVVNYDFPWNPVVLIQRIGRVDRMGSKHKNVYVSNILPLNGNPDDPKTLEHFLRLMDKLYSKLDAIRETIGLDASTLGEEAKPKDFGVQLALAKGDMSAIDAIAREIEQFTTDPIDTLAKIIQDKSIEWLQAIPDGIGAFKKGERDGIFILFHDGSNYHWRLKYYDGEKESIDSTSEIVAALMKGEVDNHGEKIEYGVLLDRMKEMKNSLKKELSQRIESEKTLGGTPVSATAVIKKIYDTLAHIEPDGESLAVRFRETSNNQAMVSALQLAIKEGRLEEKARELLSHTVSANSSPDAADTEVRLKRICWCWIQPSESIKADVPDERR